MGLSVNYMAQMRFHGKGPKYRKGKGKQGRVFYRLADLDAWNVPRMAKKEARRRKEPAVKSSRVTKKAA